MPAAVSVPSWAPTGRGAPGFVGPGQRRRSHRSKAADPGQLARLAATAQPIRHRDHRRQQDQAETDRGQAGGFADRGQPEEAGAVLEAAQQLGHRGHRDCSDRGAEDAAGAANDQHRHGRHGRAEIESGGVEDAGLVHRERAADPAEHPAEREGRQSLSHHADPDRAGGDLIFTGRLQAVAARRPLEGQRDDDWPRPPRGRPIRRWSSSEASNPPLPPVTWSQLATTL